MRIKIKDIEIAYDVTGEGKAIILIHGFPLNRKMWKEQVSVLTQIGYKTVTLDLRGQGESVAPSGSYTIDMLADDVVELMNYLNIDKAIIGGMSMGGYILLDIIERYTEKISGALFIATRSSADDEAGKQRRTMLSERVKLEGSKVISEIFKNVLFADSSFETRKELVNEVENWMLSQKPEGLAETLLAMRDRKDYNNILKNIKVPCFVITGDNDKAIPIEHTRIFEKNLPNQTTIIIPGGGHLVNMEYPKEFNEHLIKFLKSNF
jgi:pimeloyl-ACP methyl ester carboxylesterase